MNSYFLWILIFVNSDFVEEMFKLELLSKLMKTFNFLGSYFILSLKINIHENYLMQQ